MESHYALFVKDGRVLEGEVMEVVRWGRDHVVVKVATVDYIYERCEDLGPPDELDLDYLEAR
jgi:hypothetical protein